MDAQFEFTLALPYYLRLDDGTYQGRVENDEYLLHLQAVHLDLGEPPDPPQSLMFRMATGELTVAKGMKVPGVPLHFTLAKVRFFMKVDSPTVPEERGRLALSKAHRQLNHFLDVYRFVAHDTEVRPLSRSEFFTVRAGRALHAKTNVVEASGKGTLSMGVIFDEDAPAQGLPAPLDATTQAEVKQRVAAGDRPKPGPLLMLNASGTLARGEYKLAVIEMNTALDITVEEKALQVLKHLGKEDEESFKKLEKETTEPTVHRVLKEALSEDILAAPSWVAWTGQHKQLRNKVIHDGYEPTRQETADSLDAIQALRALIESSPIL